MTRKHTLALGSVGAEKKISDALASLPKGYLKNLILKMTIQNFPVQSMTVEELTEVFIAYTQGIELDSKKTETTTQKLGIKKTAKEALPSIKNDSMGMEGKKDSLSI